MADAALAAKEQQKKSTNKHDPKKSRKDLGTRLIETKRQIKDIYKVLTKEVGLWEHHDRGVEWFNAENCADLLSDLPGDYSPAWEDWQELPGLVRVIPSGKYPKEHKLYGKKYEVIYGGRRHWVCQHKGVKYFQAKVVNEKDGYDDKYCMALMHRENAKRQDILKMERARSIHKAYRDYWQDDSATSLRAMAEMYNEPLTTIADYERAGRIFFMDDVNIIFKDIRKLPVSAAKNFVAAYESEKNKVISLIDELNQEDINSTADSKVIKTILDLLKANKKKAEGLFDKKSVSVKADNIGLIKATINNNGEVTLRLPAAAHKVNKKILSDIVHSSLEELGVR